MTSMLLDIEKKLLEISGVSPLTFDDDNLINHSFSKDSIRYSRSFLYILRASHGRDGNLGYKYIDESFKAVIGYRHDRIYILPIFDSTKGIKLQKFCTEIETKTNCRIFLKKFSSIDFPKMTHVSEKNLLDDELEDDAYPETLINLSKLFTTSDGKINAKASKLIKKVRRFKKINMRFEILSEIDSDMQQKLKAFFINDAEKYASYSSIFSYLVTQHLDKRYKIMVFLYKNKIFGIYVAELLSDTEMGLYCAVSSKDRQGITEWMDWYFFHKIFSDGIRILYLGGAESKGIEYYIRKLLPEAPEYLVKTIEYDDSFVSTDLWVSVKRISNDYSRMFKNVLMSTYKLLK